MLIPVIRLDGVITGISSAITEIRLRKGFFRNLLENNRLFLSAPYALLISEALGCNLDDLYERTDGKQAPPRTQRVRDDHRGYVAHT